MTEPITEQQTPDTERRLPASLTPDQLIVPQAERIAELEALLRACQAAIIAAHQAQRELLAVATRIEIALGQDWGPW